MGNGSALCKHEDRNASRRTGMQAGGQNACGLGGRSRMLRIECLWAWRKIKDASQKH